MFIAGYTTNFNIVSDEHRLSTPLGGRSDVDGKCIPFDDDFLFEGNSLVHIALRKKEVPHEFRIRNGGHTWAYWREALPTVLGFVSDAFHQY